MKKLRKQLFALLLSSSLVMSMFGQTALADSNNGKNKQTVKISSSDQDTKNVINDEVVGYGVEVNPFYKGQVSKEELLKKIKETDENDLSKGDDNSYTDETVYDSLMKASESLAKGMIQRYDSISVKVKTSNTTFAKSIYKELILHAYDAYQSPKAGDYLRWDGVGAFSYRYSYSNLAGGGVLLTVTLQPLYYTTLEQENEVDTAVKKILSKLNLSGKTDYQKVCEINKYVTYNVKYDYDNYNKSQAGENFDKLMYTGYKAITKGTSVCQGYATMFYRLAVESGVQCRVVTSDVHAWNIVKLGSKWYQLDTTWNSCNNDEGAYFLQGEDFANHGIANEYLKKVGFSFLYPLADATYVANNSNKNAVDNAIANPEYTFKTIDGGSVKTTADGKPKLLVLYKTGCGNCTALGENISNVDFSKVDLVMAEYSNASIDDVKQEIDKAYSDIDDSAVYAYDLPHVSYSSLCNLVSCMFVTTPLVIYIGADNNIKFATSGYDAGIVENVEKYLGIRLQDKVGIKSCVCSLEQTIYDYDGKAHTPKVTLKFMGETLKENIDYTVSYINNIEPGVATVKIKAIGDKFSGVLTEDFNIISQENKPAQKDDGTYLIKTKEDLKWFAISVNAGLVGINAELGADIVVDEDWTPIGKCISHYDGKFYRGKFNGNGHYISGLNIKDEFYAGLFGGLSNDAQVINVGIKDSTIQGTKAAAAIVGGTTLSSNNVKVSGCYVENSKISSSYSSGSNSGGIVGGLWNGTKGVENCYVDSKTTITVAGTGKDFVGGIIGYSSTTTAINCYVLTTSAASGYKNFVGSIEDEKSTNCFTASAIGYNTGEICYRLNGGVSGGTVWYQKIGTDAYPKLVRAEDSIVYFVNDKYTNTAPIEKIDISTLTFDCDCGIFIHTGKEIMPSVKITNGVSQLVENVDYTLSYADNTNVGVGKITVTGCGKFKGTKQLTFTIIEEEKLTDINSLTFDCDCGVYYYSGEEIKPEVVLVDGSYTLVEGTDYNVEYSNNINVGTGTVKITGIGKYTGVLEKEFTILNESMQNCKIDIENTIFKYTGSEIKPTASVSYKGKTLIEEVDYIIEYSNNIDVGEASVTITGKNNFAGTYTVKYAIIADSGEGSVGLVDGYYILTSKEDLSWFVEQVNAGKTDINAKLFCDIDMENSEWTPIGVCTSHTEGKFYAGKFDGQGHVIKGIKVNNEFYAGLFGGLTSGAVIKNVGVTDSVIRGTKCAGAIAGGTTTDTNTATIQFCYSENNDIEAEYEQGSNAAGIIGGLWNNTYGISYCYTDDKTHIKATGTSDSFAGGIIGYSNTKTASYCYSATSDVTGTSKATTGYIAGDSSHKEGYAPEKCYSIEDEGFSTGKIAFLLNGDSDLGEGAWHQNIGTDKYPTFDQTKGKIYRIAAYAHGETTPKYFYENERKSAGEYKLHATPYNNGNHDDYLEEADGTNGTKKYKCSICGYQTDKPGEYETTDNPGEEETTNPGEEETTKPGEEETTTKPDEKETTVKPGEEETTKPGEEETTTKPGEEETTAKPSDTYTDISKDFDNIDVYFENSSFTYTGNPIKPQIKVSAYNDDWYNDDWYNDDWYDDDYDGDEDDDYVKWLDEKYYSVSYENNINAGTAKVIISGNEEYNYTGIVTTTFKINPKSLASKNVSLSKSSFTYNKKACIPTVTVKDGSKKLIVNKDYTITLANNTKPGNATATITGKNNYKETVKKTFKIVVTKATISKASSSAKKTLVVNAKAIKNVSGYQVMYSTKSNFKNAKTKDFTKTSMKITGLPSKSTYFVKVRCFVKIGSKKYYSTSWSAVKKTKIK